MFPRPASVSRVGDSERRCLDCKIREITRADSVLLTVRNSGVWECLRGGALLSCLIPLSLLLC